MNFAPFAFQQQVVSGPNLPSIITDGLFLYAASFNPISYPGTGTSYFDLSGNNFTGTLINGVTYNSTAPTSMQTDGVNDWCNFGDVSQGVINSNFTWGMWINLPTIVNERSHFQRGIDIAGQGGGWSLQLTVTSNRWQAMCVTTVPSTVGNVILGTTTITANTWYMVTGVWTNGNSLKIYVNGVLENTLNTTRTNLRQAAATFRGFSFGRSASALYSSGRSSMNYVYTRSLTNAEILNNFNTTKQYYGY